MLIRAIAIAVLILITPFGHLLAGEQISYQGRLTTPGGTPVADNTYPATFRIFSDSVGGSVVWSESVSIQTTGGLFSHILGGTATLPPSVFGNDGSLFLEVTVDGEIVGPRTRLVSAARAVVANHLRVTDSFNRVVGRTYSDSGGVMELLNDAGDPSIAMRGGRLGDSAVVLPDSSINADEILDEPGITSSKNTQLVDLSDAVMTDLAVVEIKIPSDGYIVLYGKCYALLSGTTGPNGAHVQIDTDEEGTSLFPYYTHAGLSGYVNTGTNYFPMFVTRVYFCEAGIHEFRLEGRATHPLPALAQTWDHILTAVYYPSSYGWVSQIAPLPGNNPTAIPIEIDDPRQPERTGTVYDMDLRHEETTADDSQQ